jgi:peptide/nickel transport system ATP-binding protein
MSVLSVEDVYLTYHRKGRPSVRAVAGVSLELERGEIIGLVGESGCGKSSLARACTGLEPLSGGSVRFDGEEVHPMGRRARPAHQRSLQMVFQNPYASLNPRRTIHRQITDALSMSGSGDTVAQLLELVGLPGSVATRFPHEFSGGQRQRIAVARALAAQPKVLVLDEPLSSLDASAQAQLANLLQRLARELDIGMLLISHDLSIVRYLADRLVVMYLGGVVESGPTEQIWSEPSHPYTRALIGAIPEADGRGVLPAELAGDVPDPADPPPGCRFHPRCPIAIERCAHEVPAPVARGEVQAACLLLVESSGMAR